MCDVYGNCRINMPAGLISSVCSGSIICAGGTHGLLLDFEHCLLVIMLHGVSW